MIDLHSHILANIDDGASTLNDALALIDNALSNGVSKILATPHIHPGTFDNDLASIKGAFALLCAQLKDKHHGLTLAYAAEVHICPEIISLAKSKQLPFMGKWQQQDLLLLEFPQSHIPPGSDKLIDWLVKQDIKPMIAHPERNANFCQYEELLHVYQQRGCLFQLTASSLLGDFGERAQTAAWKMLENNEITVVASDMHNLSKRPCKMQQAYDAVVERCGIELAKQLFVTTPEQIFDSNSTCWTVS